jgi:hypothetical protein
MNLGIFLEHLYMFKNSYIVQNFYVAWPSRWLGMLHYGNGDDGKRSIIDATRPWWLGGGVTLFIPKPYYNTCSLKLTCCSHFFP